MAPRRRKLRNRYDGHLGKDHRSLERGTPAKREDVAELKRAAARYRRLKAEREERRRQRLAEEQNRREQG